MDFSKLHYFSIDNARGFLCNPSHRVSIFSERYDYYTRNVFVCKNIHNLTSQWKDFLGMGSCAGIRQACTDILGSNLGIVFENIREFPTVC